MVLYLGIGILAFCLRMPHAWYASSSPLVQSPVVDAKLHHDQALLYLLGIRGKKPYFKPPLYPWILSLVYRFGRTPQGNPEAIPYLQALAGVANCLLIVALTQRLYHRKAAWASGILAALYKPFFLFEGQLLDPSLTLLLLLLSCWTLLRRDKWGGFAGGFLGLSSLMRPNLLLCVVPIALYSFWTARKRDKVLRTFIFLLLALLPPCFTLLRNGLVSGQWILISSNAGINLYTAWQPDADGFSAIEPGYEWEKTMRFPRSIGLTEERDISHFWTHKALQFITNNPTRSLHLLAKKALGFWSGIEIRNNIGPDVVASFSPMTRLPLPGFSLIFPLALWGVSLVSSKKGTMEPWILAMYILGVYVSILPFFVCGRFRLPAVPFLFPWAGLALTEWPPIASKKRLAFCASMALLGILLTFSIPAEIKRGKPHRDLWLLAVSHLEAGHSEQASHLAREGLNHSSFDPDLWVTLGNALYNLEDYSGAQNAFEEALTWAPDYSVAQANLAATLLVRGENQAAIDWAHRALHLDPDNHQVRTIALQASRNMKEAGIHSIEPGRESEHIPEAAALP